MVSAPDEYPVGKAPRQKQILAKNAPHAPVVPVKDTKGGFSITFVHLGKKYYSMTLWASTYVNQRKWVENILKQQDLMRERSLVFETMTLSEGFFIGSVRVNCAAPFGMYPTHHLCLLADLPGLQAKADESSTARMTGFTCQICGSGIVSQSRY